MKFDTGLWDRLFGERTTIEIPGPGGLRKVQVTVRWFERMQKEGKIVLSSDEKVTVHVFDPAGPGRVALGLSGSPNEFYTAIWTLGKEISKDDVDRLLDPETQAVYAITYYEAGVAVTKVVPKEYWDKAKQIIDDL